MSESTKSSISAVGAPSDLVTPLPSLGAMLWIAWFALREMSRRRRLISLGAINLLPVMVVLIIRVWFSDQGITAQMQLSALTHEVLEQIPELEGLRVDVLRISPQSRSNGRIIELFDAARKGADLQLLKEELHSLLPAGACNGYLVHQAGMDYDATQVA